MELLVLVLNKTEHLEPLLKQLAIDGVCGATILDSRGMATTLSNSEEEIPFFGILRKVLDPEREESKTIFMVVSETQAELVRKAVRQVTGGLDQPNTGILFSMPLSFVEGLGDLS